MTQFMHQQLFTGVIEFVINKALKLDGNVLAQVKQLSGKSLTINVEELGFPLCFTATDNCILVTSRSDEQCIISLTLPVLSKIKDAAALTQLIKNDELVLLGDIDIAQQYSSLAKQIDIDWQGQLANQIGDVATYKIMSLFNRAKLKVNFFTEQVSQDSTEWLLHEKNIAAHTTQVSFFNQQVMQMTKQANLIEERINRLTQQVLQ